MSWWNHYSEARYSAFVFGFFPDIMSIGIETCFFFFCCSPSRQQKQISGSHILTKCVSQKPERGFVCSELAISKQLAWKSHGLACLRKCIIHTFHTSHCSVLDAFTPMGFFFSFLMNRAHLPNIWAPAGWYWGPFGRIIPNQCVSEQCSLVVRNIADSFGLWNSIPPSHLNSNKPRGTYS